MPLHVELDGPAGAPRLVLVHGFTQTGRCWGPIADDLARDHRVVRVDAPGHGRSVDDDDADLWRAADLLADAGGDAIYLGYSMGGRLCLHLALARPDRCRGLVLLGASPGLEDPDARAARARADDRLAARIGSIPLRQFLDEWLAHPLFATLPREAAHLDERLQSRPEGLAAALRHLGAGRQDDLWPRLPAIHAPTLCLAGALDERYRAIATRTAAALGGPTHLEILPDTGHCAHLEDPAAFLRVLRTWLKGQVTAPTP